MNLKKKTVVYLPDHHLREDQITFLKELNFVTAPIRIPKKRIIMQVEYTIRTLPIEDVQ